MQDCSNCANVIRTGEDHVCKILNSTYLISNYPTQGVSCATWKQGQTQKLVKETKRDPLLSWINRFNKGKEKDESRDAPVIDEKSKLEALRKVEDALVDPNIKNKAYLLEIRKELKTTTETNVSTPVQPQVVSDNEINFKNSLGWLIAAALGAVLISLWLLKLI
jgi:hypothetical protein